MSILFPRFKKKSLTLAYNLSPEVLAEFLEEINNKKLFQCIIRSKGKDSRDDEQKKFIFGQISFKNKDQKVISLIILCRTQIICAYINNIISFFNLVEERCFKTIVIDQSGQLTCLIKLSKTRVAFASSEEKNIKIFDLSTEKYLKFLSTDGIVSYITKINKGQIAFVNYNSSITVIDINTGNKINSITGLNDCINYIIRLGYSQLVIGGSRNNSLKIWDLYKESCLQSLTNIISNRSIIFISLVQFSKSKLVSAGKNGEIFVWDLVTMNALRSWKLYCTVSNITKINKNVIAIGGKDYDIKVYDINTGVCLKSIKNKQNSITYYVVKLNKWQIACGSNKFIYVVNLDLEYLI